MAIKMNVRYPYELQGFDQTYDDFLITNRGYKVDVDARILTISCQAVGPDPVVSDYVARVALEVFNPKLAVLLRLSFDTFEDHKWVEEWQ